MEAKQMEPGPNNAVAGKQVVVTGGTNGIGLAAAEALAARGANLALVARDKDRGEAAAARARAASSGGVVDVVVADLSSQADVRRLAAEIGSRYDRVDILVNNAGALFASRQLTVDGIEKTWAVNHLAPFLLTALLSENLRLSAPARVITTASDAAKNAQIPFDDFDGAAAYSHGVGSGRGFRRYGQTKLANIVFTSELSRRLKGSGVTAYSFHPGTVATNFNHNNGALMSLAMAIIKPFSRSPAKGAETLVWLAEAPDAVLESGGFYFDKKKVPVPAGAAVEGVGARLWELSENQVEGTAPREPVRPGPG
jgi:NAD(P)-dependent dehydrogenase (short-subunit alcohol dehydrogenase family)